MIGRGPWAHVPNVISLGRLLAIPILLVAAFRHQASLFAWLLLVSLVSDIADGLIARWWHVESPLGAALDSMADFLLTLTTVVGLFTLQRAFVERHAPELLILVMLYGGEVAVSLARYGRLSSFHTYAARACAYAQGAFLVALFFWGDNPWLFYSAWTLACVAYIEEWTLLAMLPQWTHDVRGVYWVARRRVE